MQIIFYKYEGTGNDFVMIDNRQDFFPKKNIDLVKKLCDRRFGIGGDGLILLENDTKSDFIMTYYNSDGNLSSMCGNGGRCIAAFAKRLGIIQSTASFHAIDGLHHATIFEDGTVSLAMCDVESIAVHPDFVFLDTGSPHHVQMEVDLFSLDVKTLGSTIRHGEMYGKSGSNVNFVRQISENTFAIRTYERGVEDETLSCGTGATAVAVAMHVTGKTYANAINIDVAGGKLEVLFDKEETVYTNVRLIGPATFVFKGTIEC